MNKQHVDLQIKELVKRILCEGTEVETRTGAVKNVINHNMTFDLTKGFPAVTSKRLMWQAVVGELLWFLSGGNRIRELQKFTYGPDCPKDKWTIWNDDTKRWTGLSLCVDDYVGRLYGTQWRSSGSCYSSKGWDQISNLISRLKVEPSRRDHIVMAWNPADIEGDTMALKPCHVMFICSVQNGNLDLTFTMRSSDVFLGLPFNIASYALLAHLLAAWTGLKVRNLHCNIVDAHIYINHREPLSRYMMNPAFKLPELVLPEKATHGLDSLLELTALDFKGALVGYESCGPISAPLSVGN